MFFNLIKHGFLINQSARTVLSIVKSPIYKISPKQVDSIHLMTAHEGNKTDLFQGSSH